MQASQPTSGRKVLSTVSQSNQPKTIRVVRNTPGLKLKVAPTSSRSLLSQTQPTAVLQPASNTEQMYTQVAPTSSTAPHIETVTTQPQQPIYVQSQPLQQVSTITNPLEQQQPEQQQQQQEQHNLPLLVDASGNLITTQTEPEAVSSSFATNDNQPDYLVDPAQIANILQDSASGQNTSNALSVRTSLNNAPLSLSMNSNSSTDSNKYVLCQVLRVVMSYRRSDCHVSFNIHRSDLSNSIEVIDANLDVLRDIFSNSPYQLDTSTMSDVSKHLSHLTPNHLDVVFDIVLIVVALLSTRTCSKHS